MYLLGDEKKSLRRLCDPLPEGQLLRVRGTTVHTCGLGATGSGRVLRRATQMASRTKDCEIEGGTTGHADGHPIGGWTPREDDEYAILLEDDVEVSVGFFEYTLYCLAFSNYKRLAEGKIMGRRVAHYTPHG